MVDKLVEECYENIDEKELHPNETINYTCSSCRVYIILFRMFLPISIAIGTIFIYFHWFKKDEIIIKPKETMIY